MVQAAPKRMRPCELYLVRHAIAAERGDDWPDDTKRPLTATGISRFEEAVDGLAWFGVDVDEIFTSPLVRAKQTADILAARLAKRPPVKILDELAPGNETARVVAELGKRVKRSRVALVGHGEHRERRRGHRADEELQTDTDRHSRRRRRRRASLRGVGQLVAELLHRDEGVDEHRQLLAQPTDMMPPCLVEVAAPFSSCSKISDS